MNFSKVYEVVRVKISEFIEESIQKKLILFDDEFSGTRAGRYERLQKAGNKLRMKGDDNDMLRKFGDDSILYNWLRNRNTIEILGSWELLYNPNFKPIEFDRFRGHVPYSLSARIQEK